MVRYSILFILLALPQFAFKSDDIVRVYLIGDSTMANYADHYDEDKDYMKTRYPVTGWGQVFQQFMASDSLVKVRGVIDADSAIVDDRARGGRSTRTFFQEGRWRSVYENLHKNDIVIMQFGHNDAAENKPARYVDIEGYKEFLRLYVSQSLEKGAIPIVLTPVCRNYRGEDGRIQNAHGDYPKAAKEVAAEYKVPLIDLNQLSMDAFNKLDKEYVAAHYYMNLPAAKYEAYPEGKNDNTHFQPEGAVAVSRLVFEALQKIDLKQ